MVLNMRRKAASVAALAGLAGLLAGCSPNNGQSAFARMQPGASFGETTPSAAPMTLACEANQRAELRQVYVNGAPQAQMACVSVGNVVGTSGYAPVAYAPAPSVVPIGYTQPVYDTRLVAPAPAPVQRVVTTREVAPQRVAYQPARERVVYTAKPKRSVKKSAIIIGSSAAGGAGIGALIGGKKGAGIGALVGGGGAALWDQLTRRK
jgi:hypothetical protein